MAKKKPKKEEIDEEELPELTLRQVWNKRWEANRARLDLLRKLIYEFYELYDPRDFKLKDHPHLNLQMTLYRQEAIRLHEEACLLCSQMYKLPKE